MVTTETRRTQRRIQFSSVCRETTANERASPALGGAGFLAHRRLPMGKKVDETSALSVPGLFLSSKIFTVVVVMRGGMGGRLITPSRLWKTP